MSAAASQDYVTEQECAERQEACRTERCTAQRWLIGLIVGAALSMVAVGLTAALSWVGSARTESARNAAAESRIKALEYNVAAQERRIDVRLTRIEDKLDQALSEMRREGR